MIRRSKPKKNTTTSDNVPFKFTYPIRIFTHEYSEVKEDFGGKQQSSQDDQESDYKGEEIPGEETLEALIVRDGVIGANDALLKLPLDVLLDILARLPIKSLAVCRAVCKTWHRIVHHPRFTVIHHTKAITSPSVSQNCFNCTTGLVFIFKFLASKYDRVYLPDFVHFLEHENDDSFDNAVLVNPPFCPADSKIVGSCNGLLCLYPDHYSESFYIWNPVTGEYVIIPKAYRGTWDISICVSGFGFDQVAAEYKVISTYSKKCIGPNEKPSYKMVAEIYTLGSGEWRILENVPWPLHTPSSAVFVNGALHWTGDYNGALSSSELIVAFDVGSEEFRIVPPPPGLIPSCDDGIPFFIPHTCNQRLGNLGGYLTLYNQSYDICEIWVMKNYGDKSSWAKEYVISRQEEGYINLNMPRPISMMKNGNILMVLDGESLVCYDPVSKCFSEIGMIGYRYKLKVISHVGSFLSLRDIIRPKNGKHKDNTGKWYGSLHLISTQTQYSTIDEARQRMWSGNAVAGSSSFNS